MQTASANGGSAEGEKSKKAHKSTALQKKIPSIFTDVQERCESTISPKFDQNDIRKGPANDSTASRNLRELCQIDEESQNLGETGEFDQKQFQATRGEEANNPYSEDYYNMMHSVLGGAASKSSLRLNMIEQSPSAMILQDLLQHSGRLFNKDDGNNTNDDTFEVLKQMQKSQMSNNAAAIESQRMADVLGTKSQMKESQLTANDRPSYLKAVDATFDRFCDDLL